MKRLLSFDMSIVLLMWLPVPFFVVAQVHSDLAFFESLRKILLQILSSQLGGDDLTAEYLLLHLLSRVFFDVFGLQQEIFF